MLATSKDSERSPELVLSERRTSDKQVGHNTKEETQSQSPLVGAEGFLQVVLSIFILYGSLLKKLFRTKSKSNLQEAVGKDFSFVKIVESAVPQLTSLPSDSRNVLYNLFHSLQEIANERVIETNENTSYQWNNVEQSLVEICRQFVTLQLQLEYLKTTVDNIDKITKAISEPVKYLYEFQQEWDPSWLQKKESEESFENRKDDKVIALQEHFSSEQFASVADNANPIVANVQIIANQITDLSHFLKQKFTKEKIQSGYDSVVISAPTKQVDSESSSSEEILSTWEFLEMLSLVLPEHTMAELRENVASSSSSETVRWKEIRSALTRLTRRESFIDQPNLESKDSKHIQQVVQVEYQNMSQGELVEELRKRDAEITALKDQVHRATVSTAKKKSPRRSSKSNTTTTTTDKSKRKRSKGDESVTPGESSTE